MKIEIRPLRKADNAVLAEVIRKVFREFKIDMPGTVYTDPTTDNLFALFTHEHSVYWVAELNDEIVGGCGIYPTPGLPAGFGELVKFYLAQEARGKGIGATLLHHAMLSAKEMGYHNLYLESFPELGKAVHMYNKAGFTPIEKPMGNSGHYACTIWMVKKL